MGAPQVVFLLLMAAVVVLCVAKHGEARGPYNGPGAAIGAAVWTLIAWWGGFFS